MAKQDKAKDKAKGGKSDKGKQQPSLIARGPMFARESWDELKKVHPPTKQETIQGTIGVLMMVFFFGIFLGLSDFIVGRLMQAILT